MLGSVRGPPERAVPTATPGSRKTSSRPACGIVRLDSVREIWARRHVLVHNRGLADSKHVARIAGAVEDTILDVDAKYLRNAIDLLCGFGLGVILTAWAALPDRDAFAVQFATIYAATALGGLFRHEVRGGGVEEQQVHFQVQQVHDLVEDRPLQLLLWPSA